MEVKAKAYHLSKDSTGFIGIEISKNLILYNDIIGTIGDITDVGIDFKVAEQIEPTPYQVEFLTRFHSQRIKMRYSVKITYDNLSQQQKTLYLKIGWFSKQKLKWMNKLFFVQKKENGWKIITIAITLYIALLNYQTNTRVNALENINKEKSKENDQYKEKINQLEKELISERQMYQSKTFRLTSLENELKEKSLENNRDKKEIVILKNQLRKLGQK